MQMPLLNSAYRLAFTLRRSTYFSSMTGKPCTHAQSASSASGIGAPGGTAKAAVLDQTLANGLHGSAHQQALHVQDASSAPGILDSIDTLVLDCDGVLWKGSEVLSNTAEALQALRARGKRLLFVTNNSSKSRKGYVSKFAGLGLRVDPKEIVSSSYMAAAYLQSIGFNKKVFLIGPSGVEEELQEAGIAYLGGEAFDLPVYNTTDSMLALQVDANIGAVIVGWDPNFSYSKIVYSSVCLRELPECHLVATNLDHADQIGHGRMMPGTGGLVAAVEVASGRNAVNVGKGGDWLLPFLCKQYGLDPQRTAIVGDRMDTDIALGRQGGLCTILPLTGVTTLETLWQLAADQRPDHVITTFANLAGMD